jgi:hypothetical protein
MREDPDLAALKVTAPQIYGLSHRAFCMEYAAGFVPVDELPEEERKRLSRRIVDAIQVIEKNIPKYLSRHIIEEEKVFTAQIGKMRESAERSISLLEEVIGDDKQDDDVREYARERLASLNQTVSYVESLPVQPRPPTPANDYFESITVKGSGVFSIGNAHTSAVEYLKKRGMFDTWISDSREANWLYNPETDTLMAIDENIVTKGSRYSFISKYADFKNALTVEERDNILDRICPAEERDDAHLSLYVTTMEGAMVLEKRAAEDPGNEKTKEALVMRLERASGYVGRLAEKSGKWGLLKAEFSERYGHLLQDADGRAA